MSLLPAVVPAGATRRSELVPTRLAHNVAPLFGIPWPDGPFGGHTWLCDFTRITISEIARGAPLPARGEAAKRRKQPFAGAWVVQDRAVVAAPGATLPNEIVNPTINRFGPDTKSAIVLTAVNVLLGPVTEAMLTALPLLASTEDAQLPARLRLAAWAAAVIEVFRSQPALLTAAAKARAIQRESESSPPFPRAGRLGHQTLARCEIGADDSGKLDPATHPRDLAVLDRTLAALELPTRNAASLSSTDLDSDDATGDIVSAGELHNEVANHLVTLLLDAADPDGVGHVWISERAPDQLVAEAMLPSATLVGDLLGQWSALLGADVAIPKLPAEPGDLPVTARRVLVLAALAVLRQIRSELPPGRTAEFLSGVDDVRRFADAWLPGGDPVGLVARCRTNVLRINVLRPDQGNDLGTSVKDLIGATDLCVEALESGALDRGAAADVLSASCVELNAVRWTVAGKRGVLTAKELDRLLRGYWAAFGRALEVDGTDQRPVGYHLHNYAAFLGSHADSPEDLREAVRLFDEVVIPARTRTRERFGAVGSLSRTLYLAARPTTLLGERARADGRTAEARRWAELGGRWIDRVLASAEFARLLDETSERSCLFALRAAPTLLLALELETRPVTPEAVELLRRLVAAAERWPAEVVQGSVENYARYAEIVDLRDRVAALGDHAG